MSATLGGTPRHGPAPASPAVVAFSLFEASSSTPELSPLRVSVYWKMLDFELREPGRTILPTEPAFWNAHWTAGFPTAPAHDSPDPCGRFAGRLLDGLRIAAWIGHAVTRPGGPSPENFAYGVTNINQFVLVGYAPAEYRSVADARAEPYRFGPYVDGSTVADAASALFSDIYRRCYDVFQGTGGRLQGATPEDTFRRAADELRRTAWGPMAVAVAHSQRLRNDLRSELANVRQRLASPAAPLTPPVGVAFDLPTGSDEGQACYTAALEPDGPQGGCWVWFQGQRCDVPAGIVYRLIAHMWGRDSAKYEDLMGVTADVWEDHVSPGEVRKRASEASKALEKVGVLWKLSADSEARVLRKRRR